MWMSVCICKNQFFNLVGTWLMNVQYILAHRRKILVSGLSRIRISVKKCHWISVLLWCGLLWCRLLGDVPFSNFRPWNVGFQNIITLQECEAATYYAADVHFFPPKRSVYTLDWTTWTSYLASLKSQPAYVTAGCVLMWRRHNSHEICSWVNTWDLPCLHRHYTTLLKCQIYEIFLDGVCIYVCHETCQNVLKHNTKSSILL